MIQKKRVIFYIFWIFLYGWSLGCGETKLNDMRSERNLEKNSQNSVKDGLDGSDGVAGAAQNVESGDELSQSSANDNTGSNNVTNDDNADDGMAKDTAGLTLFSNPDSFSFATFKSELTSCNYTFSCFKTLFRYSHLSEFKKTFPEGKLCLWLGAEVAKHLAGKNESPIKDIPQFAVSKLESADCRSDASKVGAPLLDAVKSQTITVFALEN